MAAPLEDDPKAIRAWITYDWANSAYATTSLAILSIGLFFIVGGLLFRSVDIEKGRDNRETLRAPVAIS